MASGARQTYQRKTADERRQDLIAAGITCLGKGGMAAFTIDQICREAGISRGLINHHFHSKDELLAAIYRDMTEHLVNLDVTAGGERVLVQVIETNFDESTFNRSNLRAWLAIWGQVSSNPALSAIHNERYSTYHAGIRRALREQIGSQGRVLDVDSLARQLIALIDGLWLEYCLHSEGFSLAEARRDCYRFLAAFDIILDTTGESR